MNRLFSLLAALSVALAILTSSLLAWAFYLEPPYLTYENIPFPANLPHVKAGNVIPLTVRRCSTADTVKSYAVSHELRCDGQGQPIILPAELVTVQPGCEQSTSRINVVPHETMPGICRVHGLAIIEGRLRTIAVPWHSQPFEVVP